MTAKELTDKILEYLDNYVEEREEIDDMAYLAISTADLQMQIVDDEDALTEAWMLYPLMDLMEAGTDGYFTADAQAVAEVAESILK